MFLNYIAQTIASPIINIWDCLLVCCESIYLLPSSLSYVSLYLALWPTICSPIHSCPPSLLPLPLCSTPQTRLPHWFPTMIMLLIRSGIAPAHPLITLSLHPDRTETMSLKSALFGGGLSRFTVCASSRQSGWEHVLTSLSAHPSVNLWDASWYSRTGWAWPPSCLPVH